MRKKTDTPSSTGHEANASNVTDIVWRMRHNADDPDCVMPPYMRTNCHQAADEIEFLRYSLGEALTLVHGLADQQAMTDDWWVPARDRLARLLKAEGRTPPSGGVIHHE